MSDNQTKLEIWKEYLLNQKNSGLSVRTWGSENQISQPQFYYWKRKLSQETSAQPQFAGKRSIVGMPTSNSRS